MTMSLVACTSQAPVSGKAEAIDPAADNTEVNFEGLMDIRVRSLDVAQVRPDTSFSRYSGVVLQSPQLAFRTPDRSQSQFPLDEDQKRRFREMLSSAFDAEFANLRSIELVDEPGEDVLELTVRVENISATVPPRSASGARIGRLALTATGEVTLVLELRDSRSHEILARAVDIDAVQGVAMMRNNEMVTRWEDVEKLCSGWASMARSSLDNLIDNR